jgi:hypothetical protein
MLHRPSDEQHHRQPTPSAGGKRLAVGTKHETESTDARTPLQAEGSPAQKALPSPAERGLLALHLDNGATNSLVMLKKFY